MCVYVCMYVGVGVCRDIMVRERREEGMEGRAVAWERERSSAPQGGYF